MMNDICIHVDDKWHRLNDIYRKVDLWIVTFGSYPSTVHFTQESALDWVSYLNDEGFDVGDLAIRKVKAPTIKDLVMFHVTRGNSQEVKLIYEPDGATEE